MIFAYIGVKCASETSPTYAFLDIYNYITTPFPSDKLFKIKTTGEKKSWLKYA